MPDEPNGFFNYAEFEAYLSQYTATPKPLGVENFPTGRRLRVLARLRPVVPSGITLPEFMANAEALRGLADPFGKLLLRAKGNTDAITEIRPMSGSSNAALNPGLRDLAYEILEDIQEACEVLSNPNLYYAGVDEGIEPVPDSHVELVIWGLQRELSRELRYSRAPGGQGGHLPAVQLATFPWRIQRALAERRRLRFKQWGIGYEQWASNTWSLWDVPLDESYFSRREARGLAEVNDAHRPVAG